MNESMNLILMIAFRGKRHKLRNVFAAFPEDALYSTHIFKTYGVYAAF